MQLPGIITVSPHDKQRIKRMAKMAGESFLEENWYATWLSALDANGTTHERKKEILQAVFQDEFTAFSPYQAMYILEDETAVGSIYLKSELKGRTLEEIEEDCQDSLIKTLTSSEALLLDKQEQSMSALSDFSWANHWGGDVDFIGIYAWAVDPQARGKHSLSRFVKPFFDEADKRGINCYLECYSDRLQAIYEHLGFELIDELRDDNFDIYERRMIRRPVEESIR